MLHDNNKVVSNIIANSWVNVLIKHPILDNVIVITASKTIDQITRHIWFTSFTDKVLVLRKLRWSLAGVHR